MNPMSNGLDAAAFRKYVRRDHHRRAECDRPLFKIFAEEESTTSRERSRRYTVHCG